MVSDIPPRAFRMLRFALAAFSVFLSARAQQSLTLQVCSEGSAASQLWKYDQANTHLVLASRCARVVIESLSSRA